MYLNTLIRLVESSAVTLINTKLCVYCVYTKPPILDKRVYVCILTCMRANVWIHKQNEDKWNAIDNKSEFVNAMLAESDSESIPLPSVKLGDVLKVPGVSKGFCPHGYGKGMCKDDNCNRKYR